VADGSPLFPPAPTPAERQQAIEEPGVSWGEWFYASFLKVWIPLGFLIVDAWIAGAWLEFGNEYGILATLPPALYLEYVAFEYLWAKPSGDPSRSVRDAFHRSFRSPFQYGRWTPAGRRVRAGLPPMEGGSERSGPDPAEFF
jgi:hypothetical protein